MLPYERIVQWAAGPIAILAGWAATQITQHVGLLGGFGLGHDQIAHAIVTSVTFAVGAGVTYAAHHKWLTNLARYWETESWAPPLPHAKIEPQPARLSPMVGSTAPTADEITSELGA